MRKIGISDFSTKPTNFYNLDVIISVGYRVKSPQGTQFRIWATQRLKEYIIKGYTLNDERFKTGASMNYFNELQVCRVQFFESSTVFLLKSAAALITLRYSSNLSFG